METTRQSSAVHSAKALSQGDRSTMEAFIGHVQRPLFSYCLRLVNHRQEAEDIAQEALVRLFEQARNGGLRADAAAQRALVFTMAHNLAVDALRRKGRVLSPGTEDAAHPNPDGGLLKQQVERALADLPPQHRQALLLREYGGLAYAEIAAALGVSESVVKVSIFRARRRMAQLLDRDGQYTGAVKPTKGNAS